MKQYTVCIGGPHHELIIDGVAYNVAFNGPPTLVQLKDTTIQVKIISALPRGLDVLPAIPPHILKWASESYFGPATLLHLAPLNPIERMEAAAAAARAEPPPEPSIDPEAIGSQPTTSQAANAGAHIPAVSTAATTADVDVFKLYEKLGKFDVCFWLIGLFKNSNRSFSSNWVFQGHYLASNRYLTQYVGCGSLPVS